ncbi:MAG: hypothetical protein EOL97_09970 [Spirochaetia bacterium]|nr:hypothetical protein [Spirochaetia bacterium]
MNLLLRQSKRTFSLKDNFRNSINDLLVLATALYYQEKLVTVDNLLFTFMEEETDFLFRRLDKSFIEISEKIKNENNEGKNDSKRYINNSLAIFNRKNSN